MLVSGIIGLIEDVLITLRISAKVKADKYFKNSIVLDKEYKRLNRQLINTMPILKLSIFLVLWVNVDKNMASEKNTIEENNGVILNKINVFLSNSPLNDRPM